MEPVVRVGVVVTFLRMDRPPADPAPVLPEGMAVRQVPNCSVELYRHLYNTVGNDYVWWLRRTLSDRQLAALLRDPNISIHVLERGEEILGFYELDRNPWPVVNLSYFGLMPQAVGARILLAIAEPFRLAAGMANASCSIGIAYCWERNARGADLLNQADHALYEAKASGKNALRFCDQLQANPENGDLKVA